MEAHHTTLPPKPRLRSSTYIAFRNECFGLSNFRPKPAVSKCNLMLFNQLWNIVSTDVAYEEVLTACQSLVTFVETLEFPKLESLMDSIIKNVMVSS